MKRQIHAYRGHDTIAVEGHNIKLGPRRHPRDRVLRADPAVDRRRPASGAARAGDAGDAQDARRTAAGSTPRRAPISTPPTASCASSRTACRWWPTSRPTRCRPIAKGSSASPALPALRTATRFAEALLAHLRNVQRHYATLFENAPAIEAGRRPLLFPARCRRSRDARPVDRDGLSPSARSVGPGARLVGGQLSRAARQLSRAPNSPNLLPSCCHHFARSANPDAALDRVRPVPRRHEERAGCFRCCGRIPT